MQKCIEILLIIYLIIIENQTKNKLTANKDFVFEHINEEIKELSNDYIVTTT